MVSLDYTLFIQIINFLLIIFVLNLLLYKPLLKIIDKRDGQIEGAKAKVRSLDQQIEQMMAEYEEKLRKARQEAMRQKEAIQQSGAEEARRIVGAVSTEIAKAAAEFKLKVEKEKQEALSALKGQSEQIAVEISEKILGRSLQ